MMFPLSLMAFVGLTYLPCGLWGNETVRPVLFYRGTDKDAEGNVLSDLQSQGEIPINGALLLPVSLVVIHWFSSRFCGALVESILHFPQVFAIFTVWVR